MTTHWLDWHRDYDDPQSSLSRRLQVVREHLARAVAHAATTHEGEVRIISLCAGDGRDLLPVLASSGSADRIRALLVELDPLLADQARRTAETLGLPGVEVRTADAGRSAVYATHRPAHVVLACGVFGNVPAGDALATVAALPALTAAHGTVVWTRGRGDGAGEPADALRAEFARHGFTELAFVAPDDARFRVGVHRRDAAAAPTTVPDRLFSFVPARRRAGPR